MYEYVFFYLKKGTANGMENEKQIGLSTSTDIRQIKICKKNDDIEAILNTEETSWQSICKCC